MGRKDEGLGGGRQCRAYEVCFLGGRGVNALYFLFFWRESVQLAPPGEGDVRPAASRQGSRLITRLQYLCDHIHRCTL